MNLAKTTSWQTNQKAQIYQALHNFALGLTKAKTLLPQCRVTASDEANGIIAVNMEEWLYFKRTAWVTNRTRFYYQLLFQIKDGGFTATLRNIRYLYDEEHNGGQNYSAEGWITDDKAIVKKGTKLSKYSGSSVHLPLIARILFSKTHIAQPVEK